MNKLRFFGFILAFIMNSFAVSAAIEYNQDYIPPGFSDLEDEENTTSVDIYFLGNVITTSVVSYDLNTIKIKTPDNIINHLKRILMPEFLITLQQDIKKKFDQNSNLACGKAQSNLNCGFLKPDVIGVIFDSTKLRLDIFINPKFIRKEYVTKKNILPGSTSGVSFLHDVNSLYSGSKAKTSYDIGMNTVLGYKESYFDIESTYNRISGEDSINSSYNIDNALFVMNKWENNYKAGWAFNQSTFMIGQKRFLGFSVSSSLDQIIDKNDINTLPIEKFLNTRSKVEIYKDDRLISSKYYDAGYQKLRTSSFPNGTYDVRVRIEDENGNITETTELYSKDPILPPFNMWLPYFNVGVFEKSFDRSKDLMPQQSDKFFMQGGFSRRILPYMAYKQDFMIGRGIFLANPSLNIFYKKLKTMVSGLISSRVDFGGYFSSQYEVNDFIKPTFTYTQLKRKKQPNSTNSKFDIIPRSNEYTLRLSNSSKFDNHSLQISFSNSQPFDGKKDNMLSLNLNSYFDVSQNWRLAMTNALDFKKNESVYLLTFSFHVMDKHTFRNERSYTKTKGQQRQYENTTSYRYQHEKFEEDYKYRLSTEVASGTDSDSLRPKISYENNYYKFSPSAVVRRVNNKTNKDYLVQFRTALVNSGSSLALANVKNAENGILIDITGGDDSDFRVDVNGQPKEIVEGGGGTFIAAPAFKTYEVVLIPNSDRRFKILNGNKRVTTVYPGNIAKLSWEVVEIYSLAGKVVDENNNPVTDYEYENNGFPTKIGKDGFMSIELSTKQQEFILKHETNKSCKIDLTTINPIENGLSFNEKMVCKKI